MQLSNSPGKLVLPFASSGNKNTIPVNSQIGITPGAASLADGFPPLTMTPVAAGGVPPSGLDMNGILYEMSAIVRWANAGGGYPYDADFATSADVGGYPKGARVLRADGSGYWFNTVDNNETDPDSGAAVGWVPDFTSGAATVPMASANVTLTPVQYGKPIIVITGTLTSDLNLVFPEIDNQWLLVNLTSGGFTISAKTETGVGVPIPNGFVGPMVCYSNSIFIRRRNDIFDFGATGDGTTDDTDAFVAAVTVSDTVILPDGDYIISNSTFTKSVKLTGESKNGTRLIWKASSPESSLLKFTTNQIVVEISNLTIDGNLSNQTDSTGYYGSVEMSAVPAGSALTLDNVKFTNGRITDVIVFGPETESLIKLNIRNCEFADGMVGTATRAAQCVTISEGVDAELIGNSISQGTKPVAYGRAGFIMQRPNGSTNTFFGRLTAIGNTFLNVGRGTNDTLGCIDVYSGADQIIIEGNRAKYPIGRAFCAKADSANIQICNNNVFGFDGLSANLPAIVLYDQAASYGAFGGKNANISGNVIRGLVRADNYGIVVDGRNSAGVATFQNVNVCNNVFDGIGLSAIYARFCKDVNILGNVISGGVTVGFTGTDLSGVVSVKGNLIDGATTNAINMNSNITGADVTIRANDIYNTTVRAINLETCNSYVIEGNTIDTAQFAYYTNGSTEESKIGNNTLRAITSLWSKSGTDSKLEYAYDRTSTAMGFATRTATISAGAIGIFADWHYVDTEGGAATDDLDTINGGFDGRRLVLFAASPSRDVVLKDGTGNLHLAGDFTLTHGDDTIELLSRGGQWYELSRSDNAA